MWSPTSVSADVEALSVFRDGYLESHPGASAASRDASVGRRIASAAAVHRAALAASAAPSSALVLALGRLLNVGAAWSAEAEELLERAVKLCPNSWEAHLELGLSFTKKTGGGPAATVCFTTALSKERNSRTLSQMAVVWRQEAASRRKEASEARDLIRQSLNAAKEAAALTPDDSSAHYSLGNAYLAYFFACAQQNSSFMQLATEAYQKSIQLGRERNNSTLYYNYAQALVFEQNYGPALEALRRSVSLDPTFTEASECLLSLSTYLSRFQHTVSTKGKVKGKRLEALVSRPMDLGPFAGGNFKDKVALEPVPFGLLEPGRNAHKVVIGRVVAVVFNDLAIPYSFVLVDAEASAVGVGLYNFTAGFGLSVGASVAVPEPFLVPVAFAHDGAERTFPCLRVPSPQILVVNGRKLSKDTEALTEVSFKD